MEYSLFSGVKLQSWSNSCEKIKASKKNWLQILVRGNEEVAEL